MGVSFKVAKAGARYRPKLLQVEDIEIENGPIIESQRRDNKVLLFGELGLFLIEWCFLLSCVDYVLKGGGLLGSVCWVLKWGQQCLLGLGILLWCFSDVL